MIKKYTNVKHAYMRLEMSKVFLQKMFKKNKTGVKMVNEKYKI